MRKAFVAVPFMMVSSILFATDSVPLFSEISAAIALCDKAFTDEKTYDGQQSFDNLACIKIVSDRLMREIVPGNLDEQEQYAGSAQFTLTRFLYWHKEKHCMTIQTFPSSRDSYWSTSCINIVKENKLDQDKGCKKIRDACRELIETEPYQVAISYQITGKTRNQPDSILTIVYNGDKLSEVRLAFNRQLGVRVSITAKHSVNE